MKYLLARGYVALKNRNILLQHFLRGKETDIITDKKYIVLSEKGKHCFFGYYDISPFSNDSMKVLNLTTDGNPHYATLNYYDIAAKRNIFIADTHVWNWQQGCRLRWFPGKPDTIFFNDIEHDHYCGRILDITHKRPVKTLSRPLYDIDPTGRYGLTLNFAKLGVKRPGYGYSILPFREEEFAGNDGIDFVQISDDSAIRLVTFGELNNLLNHPKSSCKDYYINHLSFSPSGDRFLFFFLDASTRRHESYLFVYDIKERMIIPLETHDKVSHYVWKNENEIIATVYDDNMNCGYYIYHIQEREKEKYNHIGLDGHPSLFSGDSILTDTYPDEKYFQHLYIANKAGEEREIARLFHNPFMAGVKRTDLHPRTNCDHSLVCTDINKTGKRQMCIFYL